MTPKLLWSKMVMRFGLIPFVLACLLAGIGILGILSGMLYGVFALFGNSLTTRVWIMFFVLTVVMIVLWSAMGRSIKVGVIVCMVIYMTIFMAFSAIDWVGIVIHYIQNGLVINQTTPSPWPMFESNRGVWWSIRLFLGMVSTGCAATGLALFIKSTFKRVIAPALENIKTLNSKVQQKAQEEVERQKLKTRHADITSQSPDVRDAL